MDVKKNHQVNVVRVGEPRIHPNADSLELFDIGGYQIVAKKGQFKPGDLGVFIQPDSVVPQTEPFRFIWNDHVGIDGLVPERRRRITVRRFRKEWSEGLLLPTTDFPELGDAVDVPEQGTKILTKRLSDTESWYAKVGADVSEILGVTHWVPEIDRESTQADITNAPRRKPRCPHSLRGWFWYILYKLGYSRGIRCGSLDVSFDAPVYDVDSLKNNKGELAEGEPVYVTEKIHGSNGRYVVVDGKFYCGSRQQWKADGGNVWWTVARSYPQIEKWCREHEGIVLYSEVGPTQKGFTYGATSEKPFFFAFDTYNPATNEWIEPRTLGFEGPHAPPLVFEAGTMRPAVFGYRDGDFLRALVDGPSTVSGATNVREGVVISSAVRRCKLKIVSNAFLEKDSK